MEKHGNILLTTCCTEICNKSYQIQRKKKNVAFILALKSIGERYRPSHASCHVHVTVVLSLPWPGHGSLSSLHVCTLNIIPTVQAQRKCVQKYFCCKRTLAIVTYIHTLTNSQFSHHSAQSRLGIPCTVYMRYETACSATHMNHSISQCRRCRNGLLIMWLFESTRIRNSYFFRKRNFCVQCLCPNGISI